MAQGSPKTSREKAPELFALDGGRRLKKQQLPKWIEVDVDTVLPDNRCERALREAKIGLGFGPSSGLTNTDGLKELALQEPAFVVRKNGHWWCITNWALICEAQQVLEPPRYLPVCERTDVTPIDLVRVVLIEQVVRTVRHQLWPEDLIRLAMTLLRIVPVHPLLFRPLKNYQLAQTLRRSQSWLMTEKRKAKKAAAKRVPPPEKNVGPEARTVENG